MSSVVRQKKDIYFSFKDSYQELRQELLEKRAPVHRWSGITIAVFLGAIVLMFNFSPWSPEP
ncbi:MAG: hypothetical protein AAF202_13080, partial [Pseudomonadota bacterium]